jgi:hypothetical protein
MTRSTPDDDADLRRALGDELLPNQLVIADLSISEMTASRWDQDDEMAALGWPEKIVINRRIYRSGEKYRAFKRNLVDRAIRRRSIITRAHKIA